VGEAVLDRAARLEAWGVAVDRARPLPADAECLDRRGLGDGDGAAAELADVVDAGPSTETAVSPVVSVYGSPTRLAAPNPTPTAAPANTSHRAIRATRLGTRPSWPRTP
jgi:hypothetical protein